MHFGLSNNARINVSGIVYVDSSSSSALSAGGNAQVTAAAIYVHGGIQKGGNASLYPAPVTGTPVLADPLASLSSRAVTTQRFAASAVGRGDRRVPGHRPG